MKKTIAKAKIDLSIIGVILLVSYCVFNRFDLLEMIVDFSNRYENYEIDEVISTAMVALFLLSWFSFRRWRETLHAKRIIDEKNRELALAGNEIKRLRGILPLCSFCKKIRNDSGYWEQVDYYLQKHSGADISHALCPECFETHYPEEYRAMKKMERS